MPPEWPGKSAGSTPVAQLACSGAEATAGKSCTPAELVTGGSLVIVNEDSAESGGSPFKPARRRFAVESAAQPTSRPAASTVASNDRTRAHLDVSPVPEYSAKPTSPVSYMERNPR